MDIKSILITGLTAGVGAWIFSTVLGTVQRRAIANLPHPNKQYANEVEQNRSVNYECKFDDIFPETINAIRTIKRSKIKKADKKTMSIIAKTGINWKTFGDKIKVTFQENGVNHISVELTSKPKMWGTSIDYGKNLP